MTTGGFRGQQAPQLNIMNFTINDYWRDQMSALSEYRPITDITHPAPIGQQLAALKLPE